MKKWLGLVCCYKWWLDSGVAEVCMCSRGEKGVSEHVCGYGGHIGWENVVRVSIRYDVLICKKAHTLQGILTFVYIGAKTLKGGSPEILSIHCMFHF
jgi:hypothetical protein